MAGIGVPELIIVLVILLVIFGPKRLPGAGKALGTGMREFKDSISGKGSKDDDAEERPALTPSARSRRRRRPGVDLPGGGRAQRRHLRATRVARRSAWPQRCVARSRTTRG
jgi:TatA/E family protein of Tat protein translocase